MTGNLLARGTAAEVIDAGPSDHLVRHRAELYELAEQLRGSAGVEQAVAFGATLHVSGDDAGALESAIAPFRTPTIEWRQVESGWRMFSFI